jgi:hypothetical protein
MRRLTSIALPLIAACAGAALLASPAQATNYKFTEGGFTDGATLTGSFTAIDLDGNGVFGDGNTLSPSQQEITAFSVTFSGNSLVMPFQFGLPDLHAFIYDPLGLSPYFAGYLGFKVFHGAGEVSAGYKGFRCSGKNVCAFVVDLNGNGDATKDANVTSPAPEPATWAMMLLGFGSVGTVLRASRPITGERRALRALA